MASKKETMLEAFLRQSKINDADADQRDQDLKDLSNHFVAEAMKKGFKNSSRVGTIPSRFADANMKAAPLKCNEQPLPGQKNSLEINRWKHIGGKDREDDGIEMEEI